MKPVRFFRAVLEDLVNEFMGVPTNHFLPNQVDPATGDIHCELVIRFEDAILGTQHMITMDDRKFYAKIPAGIRDGVLMRYAGEGNLAKDGQKKGDFYVRLRVQPHARFERQDYDIVSHMTITSAQAKSGEIVVVPTIYGDVKLALPRNVADGKVIRFKDKGVPKPDTQDEKGDHLLCIHIVE